MLDGLQQRARAMESRPKQSVWAVYRRLLGYAFYHKFRLVVSIVFALVVALSFTGMILGIGGVVQVVFGQEAEVMQAVATQAERVESIPVLNTLLRQMPLPGITEDVPPTIQARFEAAVHAMREHRMPALYIACGIVLVLTMLGGIARFIQEYFAGSIGASISVRLGREMFENIIHCSMRFFEQHTTGEIVARFTNDVFQVNQGLAGVFVKVVREPIKMVFFLIVALMADPLLTVVGICVLPPVVLVLLNVGKRFKRSMRRSLEKVAALASVANEVFRGIAIIKSFCMEDYEKNRARRELGNLYRFLLKMVRANALVGPLVEAVLVVGVIGFVLATGYRLEQGAISPGDLATLFVALAMILDPIRKLSNVNNLVMGSVASAERVFEFIDAKPEIVEKPDAIDLPILRDVIRFDNVRFSYTGESDVLSDLTFEIRKGETVAIVGFSGAGKSTLAKLVPRFYDVTAGSITIDGVDIRDVTFQSLRGQISIVTQDTVLFNESIRANIAFGKEDYAEERVQEAAQAAHAEEFIAHLPAGFDTVIGESGATLSGGQRQRLAIARAIIKDPAILILDEATSSLDSESERAIQDAIARFVEGRTAIVIAHRLSTILRADRIIVLDQGRIADVGPHQELLQRDGIYKRLYETQFGAQPVEEETP